MLTLAGVVALSVIAAVIGNRLLSPGPATRTKARSISIGTPTGAPESSKKRAPLWKKKWVQVVCGVLVAVLVGYWLYGKYGEKIAEVTGVEEVGVGGIIDTVLSFIGSLGLGTYATFFLLLGMIAPIIWSIFLVPRAKKLGANTGIHNQYLWGYGAATVLVLLMFGFNAENLWYPAADAILKAFVGFLYFLALWGLVYTFSLQRRGVFMSVIAVAILLGTQIWIAGGVRPELPEKSAAAGGLNSNPVLVKFTKEGIVPAFRKNEEKCNPRIRATLLEEEDTRNVAYACDEVLFVCAPTSTLEPNEWVVVSKPASQVRASVVPDTVRHYGEEYRCTAVAREETGTEEVSLAIGYLR